MLKPCQSCAILHVFLGGEIVFLTVTLISSLTTLQKKRKLSIQTARKRTQFEILERSIDTDRRKNHERSEESKEISRLRRRVQEAENTIEKLKEEKEEYRRQCLRLSRNLADISSINVELHKMLSKNSAAVSSVRTNGARVVQPEGNSSNVISISGAALKEKEISTEVLSLPFNDGSNVISISGAALKEKEMSTEVLSLPFNDDDDFVLADPIEEKENSELIHGEWHCILLSCIAQLLG
ncbi:uncharacterized protein LOC124159098 [Ischnura elegans]|uniref:uncharacterized protein LOC124159098 n=1 Tax=Ischnura elegans TaxID=197161 RepID=UPI001ED89F4B|nr:uncharacterized protein LOC124159098 [Ischnura elegans]